MYSCCSFSLGDETKVCFIFSYRSIFQSVEYVCIASSLDAINHPREQKYRSWRASKKKTVWRNNCLGITSSLVIEPEKTLFLVDIKPQRLP